MKNLAQRITSKIRNNMGKQADKFRKAATAVKKIGKKKSNRKSYRRVYFRDRDGIRTLPSGVQYAMYRTGWHRIPAKPKKEKV